MTIVVVGKSSLMGQEMQKHYSGPEWLFLSHGEAINNTAWVKDADCVINFSFSPALRTGAYNAAEDIDSKLAEIVNTNTHYIMMSSRTVYGPPPVTSALTETQTANPQTPYARNKLEIEKRLQDALGDRLTILRGANVFGFEPGRRSFFGMALDRLKSQNEILFDMSPDVKRDFISAHSVGQALGMIARTPQPGFFNLGSGYGTACRDIASWIIEGYGQGTLRTTSDDMRDDFYLDMAKTRAAFKLPTISPATLKQECVACGIRLKETA